MDIKTVSDLIANQYGVRTKTNINPLTDNVDIAITNILKSNPLRLAIIIINLSANTIYIAPDNAVSSTRGIMLVSNGGSVTMDFTKDMELTTYDWFGTAGADDSEVFVMEVVMVKREVT